jgi:ribonuclease G
LPEVPEGSPVSEEILINSTPTESRVALVADGVLQEVWLDRASCHQYVGNIYKGTVCRVLPGMQAAFIDIGMNRTAFLHASDIYRTDASPSNEPGTEIDLPGDQREVRVVPPINTMISERSEVFVQVSKDPIGSKGARLTAQLSIPSRFLVLLPDCEHIGISARIEDENERSRLIQLVSALRADEHCGFIIRTNAQAVDESVLAEDMTYLQKKWQSIKSKMITAGPGECVNEELPMALKALRDLMHSKTERVRIDSPTTYDQALKFTKNFIPAYTQRIEHHDSDNPLFDLYGIETEIEKALDRNSPLKSGGYLVIDQTEAMTTIDVNTGGFVGNYNQEETIFKTNLEAARSIARQLRLRNLGGIIIIDFIDMVDEEHRNKVLESLKEALKKDHARTSVCEFSPLGLVEMTRKRSSESLGHLLCKPCGSCSGRGSVKSTETVSQEVFRQVTRSGQKFKSSNMRVMASTDVVNHILDEQLSMVHELEKLIGMPIQFQSDDHYTREQFDVVLL